MADKWILAKGGDYLKGICYRCGKPVKLEKAAVMEEDGSWALYHDMGVPEDRVSGIMVVGQDCAKTVRKLAVGEGVPYTLANQPDVWNRVEARAKADIAETQQLQPGHGLYASREQREQYLEFVLEVIATQRKQAGV